MSAHRCLTAWNDPITLPNCSRSLAYAVASSVARSARPSCSALVSTMPTRRARSAAARVGEQLARGHVARDDRQRRERVDRTLDRRGRDRGGVEAAHAVVGEREQRVEIGRVLEHRHRGARLEATDDRLAGGRAVDPGRGQERGDEGAGDERAAELLEHERGLGGTELQPAVGLGQGDREDTGLAQLAPAIAVEVPGRLDGAHVVEGEASVEERRARPPAARPGRRSARSPSAVAQRSLGRPSTRSPTMLRFTCDVPAAMVIEIA